MVKRFGGQRCPVPRLELFAFSSLVIVRRVVKRDTNGLDEQACGNWNHLAISYAKLIALFGDAVTLAVSLGGAWPE